jgi:hypothetical protein
MPETQGSRRPSSQYGCTARLIAYMFISWLVTAIILAIGGLTGTMKTEYQMSRGQQAIALVLGLSCFGLLIGPVVFILVNLFSAVLSKIRQFREK